VLCGVLMNRRFRSLLIESANIRTPSLHVMRLAVHRHLPELARVGQHSHSSSQALLYLSGEGWQRISRGAARVEPGTLVVIPPGTPHSFARSGTKMPLCLAVDFRVRPPGRCDSAVSSLNRSELSQVRQSLAQLARIHSETGAALPIEASILVLQVMVALLRSAGWLPREAAPSGGQPGGAILRLLSGIEPSTPLGEVVGRSGYQRDHLNSLVKRETGLTLGQYRAERRLALAKRLLGEQVQVSAVATSVGLPDQSYFARWFRRQTGQQPSNWGRNSR
jgi:AraC family transcriptional regulator, transcriptional activator of pobA